MKEVTFTRYRVCADCDGKGGSNVTKCAGCKGNGVMLKTVQLGPGMITQAQVRCDKCGGKGESVKEEDRCKSCEGKRVREQEKVIQVPIEKGVPDSHDYILTGEADEVPDVIAGDLYARVIIEKHEQFERRGADLVIIKEISLLEALTGITTSIKHLDGKEYIIATAPGEILENKELKTIRGLGMPFYKDSITHGNLHFEFLIHFPPPKSITSDHEKAIREAFSYTDTNAGIEKQPQAVALDDFSEELLNPRARKASEAEDEEEGQGIQCQGQ
jgi:DnaJ homolog subfamily A member 2